MITVHVLVDQFIHRWDGTSGELWFCVRPHVSTVADFIDWATDPDSLIRNGSRRFDFVFQQAGQQCPAQLFPINLPSGVDLWHGLSAKGQASPNWTRYRRHAALKDAAGNPYSKAFNGRFSKAMTTEDQSTVLSSIELHFYSGGEFDEATLKLTDPFANTNGQRHPAFKPLSGSPVTSMFWLLGLMHRIGGQDALTDLRGLAGYDLVLTDGSATPGDDEASGPVGGRLAGLHMPGGLPGDAEDAERAFFDSWLPALPAGQFAADIAGTHALSLPAVAYCKPPRRNLTFELTPEGAALFRTPPASETANGPESRTQTDHPRRLVAMEVEVVRAAAGDAFTSVDVQLGLRLTGRLQPYRRSPVPLAPGTVTDAAKQASRLQTIVEFQPDENCNEALARFLAESPSAEVDRLLKGAFASATVAEEPESGGGWTLAFLGAQAFAWEEMRPRIRLLAIPAAKATPAEPGQPRGLARGIAKLSVANGPRVSLERVDTLAGADGSTHTVGFWANPTSPVVGDHNAVWVLAANPASSVADVENRTTRITQVFQDDFDFERAQSAVAIDGSVTMTTAPETNVVAAATAAGLPKPDGLSPHRNYAEGFADYNVLRQAQPLAGAAARERDWPTQTVGAAPGCNGELLAVAQTMPFIETWPETPRDTIPGKDVVECADWTKVRDHIGEIYRVRPGAAKRSISLALRHTFGPRIEVGSLSPTLPLPWPVDVPTAAETRSRAGSTAVRDGNPFVRIDYGDLKSNRCTITFDPKVLVFDAPPLETDVPAPKPEDRVAKEQAFSSGMQAWRALGELCDPGSLADVGLQPVAYDLFGSGPDRKIAADWQAALRDMDRLEASDPGFLKDLQAWARSCFAAKGAPDLKPFTRSLAVKPQASLAKTASIGRFDWTTTRSADRDTHVRVAPADTRGVDLKYVTDRLGSAEALRTAIQRNVLPPPAQTVAKARKVEKTLEQAWRESQTGTPPEGPAKEWCGKRQRYTDSITPEELPTGGGEPSTIPAFLDAMQSLRTGTDWFPIPGSPSYKSITVTPTLIPCGFCPVAPHVDLGGDTERVLETLLSALQDYVDLALPKEMEQIVTGTADDWRAFFKELEGASAAYSGLMERIVGELLRAQPAADAGTTKSVAQRSAAINAAMPPALVAAARIALIHQPALFKSSKALLLSEISASGVGATLSPLAGAQFSRWTASWKDASSPATETSVRLDVGRLIALEKLPTSGAVTGGIAFLEPLEDSLYDNSFDVRANAQRVETFEAVIDAEAAKDPKWMWTTQIPVTPIAAQQGDVATRRVPLASRQPVAAPIAVGAIALGPTVGGLTTSSRVKLSRLLQGDPGLDSNGDYVVEAALQPQDASTLRFETDVLRLVYLVQGDEEGAIGGSPTAFENDLFTLERKMPDQTVTSASTQRLQVQPPPESELSKNLRLLSAAVPGTSQAREWMVKVIPHLATIASEYIKRPTPGLAPSEGLSLQVKPDGTTSLAYTGGTKPAVLRNAAMLKPAPGSPVSDKAMRVLVLDVLTDVWSDVGFALRQSRNAGQRLGGYRFDPYFATTAVPSTPPARHRPTKAAKNLPSDWRPKRILKLPNRKMDLQKLLAMISEADVGNHSETLFTPVTALSSGYRLVVSVWAEQFQRPQWAGTTNEPDGRHLPWAMAYDMTADGLKAAPDVEFTMNARHFSIDLQWWTPSGESAMRLERVFATA